ncbi:MAG: hypothetical protein ACR2RE_29225 [Geminicoccaceae bacterium]
MTLSEFKAWFEGFTEAMEKPPNAKQWKRICARVKEIDGERTTWPVFVDRYEPRHTFTPGYPLPYWMTWNTTGGLSGQSHNLTVEGECVTLPNTSEAAFTDIGRIDAMECQS